MRGASIIALAVAAGAGHAQVVINEVFENPSGSGSVDRRFEFIELYGKPGMALDGYALALVKGGIDVDGDDIPGPIPAGEDVDPGDELPEIDEAWSLDGLTLGTNGLLMLYNDTGAPSISLTLADAATTTAGFEEQFIPAPDTAGNLANDTSSTYILLRLRPGAGAWAKDTQIDVDFDGKTDYGFEVSVGALGPASVMEPYQMIDDVAWSHLGGKEYVRSSEQEISDTPGFNPDALSRLAYFGENPMLGMRVNGSGMTVPTRTADEEWVYGDTESSSGSLIYNPLEVGAPTDPAGDGFMDITITDGVDTFQITPGNFNDAPAIGITQFRFIDGDLNFDGVADSGDLTLFDTISGRAFDEQADLIDDDTGMPVEDPNNPGTNLQAYVFQGRLANAYLAATCLDQADGPGGANADTPTPADRTALVAIVGEPCPADQNSDGIFNNTDINLFVSNFLAQQAPGDINSDGNFNNTDINLFVQQFLTQCM